MLIFVLIKGVPSRTTQVVTVGGVLKREAMDIVLNPYDLKALQAADYVKRRIGGKVIALTMGPDFKLLPIMSRLYDMEIEGIDEAVILSDKRMAGADTLATSYTLALGIKRVLEIHKEALNLILENIDNKEEVERIAKDLYHINLLPNKIYSSLKPFKDSLIQRYLEDKITKEEVLDFLEKSLEDLNKFIIFTGIKSSDGETGSVGPQVAEGLSELLNITVPHVTFVSWFNFNGDLITIKRKIYNRLEILEGNPPILLTIATDYEPEVVLASYKKEVRAENYKGKILKPTIWNADNIKADVNKIGLLGSPTLVGPGVDIGKPPTQKFLGRSLVFKRRVDVMVFEEIKYGPYEEGDLADNLPERLKNYFLERGDLEYFDYKRLIKEVFAK
ncbi:Caffeyl-CoA reductase-Etf complex subunit CarD [archaeon HR06]|nr:Caffeyl-CoA reductase-Etf complex subunit CarD [archaeon HR06]